MTPLPRWVLLALLLAVASAHSDQHACVRLCRAQNRGLETMGVCDHQQKLVPQSSGGRFPTHRLFRLCLDPCTGPGSPNNTKPLLYDSSHTCRSFRGWLIRRHACSCPDWRDDETRKLDKEDSPRLEGSSKDPEQHGLNDPDSAGLLGNLEKIVEDRAVKIVEKKLQAKMKSLGTKADKVDSEGMEGIADLVVEDLNSDELIAGADSSEEPPVDWDQWCMAQCNNGRGGSACNCDIIP